jgi:hypothetical protein
MSAPALARRWLGAEAGTSQGSAATWPVVRERSTLAVRVEAAAGMATITALGENSYVTASDDTTWKATAPMAKSNSGPKDEQGEASPSQLIDARIKELSDWRGEMLARIRELVKQADPEVVEEWKWRGVPTWYHEGIICTGETYKNHVKMTFAKGASLEDPSGLFNSSLEGNSRRAIDVEEGDKIDEKALKALIRAAVALNESSASRRR